MFVSSKDLLPLVPDRCRINDINDFVQNRSIEEIRNSVLVIDGFDSLYKEITNELLDKLVLNINNGVFTKIITFDSLNNVEKYSATELYLRLVKCRTGFIVGGGVDNRKANLLSKEFFFIPEEYRNKKLDNRTAIAYSYDAASYIRIGEI